MMTMISFYFALGVTVWLIWLSGTVVGGSDLHTRGLNNPLCMKPSWMPKNVLLGVLRQPALYRFLCHAPPACLLLASYRPESLACRLLAALSFTAYSLVETSVTHSHRDYPATYALWVLACFGESATSQGLILGIAVHLMISSGIAKLRVGGVAWAYPSTMRGVLGHYVNKAGADGPLIKPLTAWARSSKAVLFGFGAGTLFFECVVVPLGLFLPPGLRVMVAYGAFGMHVGIAALQSLAIGTAFLVNSVIYAYGFGSGVQPFTSGNGWPEALAVASASAFYSIFIGLLPENFPSTPFALFAWNGKQWDSLFEHLVTGNTRLVVSPDGPPQVGAEVFPKVAGTELAGGDGRPDCSQSCTFDAWDQFLGETLVPSSDFAKRIFPNDSGLHVPNLCRAVDEYLKAESIVVIDTGRPALQSFFVQLKPGTQVVARVLADAHGAVGT